MAKKTARQRQKARQRKLAKQKRKRSQRSASPSRAGGRRGQLRRAGAWSLVECLLAEAWRDTTQIVQIIVARRGPQDEIAAVTFLVDLGCLGVKDAYSYLLDAAGYADLRAKLMKNQKLVPADLNLVAKIIREAIAYAEQFGFKPHSDYRLAQPILGDADPGASDEEIPLGVDGKPYYASGPYDNVDAILAKLTRAVGPDGFSSLIGLGNPLDDFLDDDEYDDGEWHV